MKLLIVSFLLFSNGSLELSTSMPMCLKHSPKYFPQLWRYIRMQSSNFCQRLLNLTTYSTCVISLRLYTESACLINKNCSLSSRQYVYGCMKYWGYFQIDSSINRTDLTYLISLKTQLIESGSWISIKYLSISTKLSEVRKMVKSIHSKRLEVCYGLTVWHLLAHARFMSKWLTSTVSRKQYKNLCTTITKLLTNLWTWSYFHLPSSIFWLSREYSNSPQVMLV